MQLLVGDTFTRKKKESKIKLCPFGWISPNWAKYAKYIRNCQPVSGAFCSLPSGKPTVCYGKSQSLIGNYRPINKLNGPCSIAILNYQRVYDMPICPRRLSICWRIHGTHGTTLRNPERRDCWPSKKSGSPQLANVASIMKPNMKHQFPSLVLKSNVLLHSCPMNVSEVQSYVFCG